MIIISKKAIALLLALFLLNAGGCGRTGNPSGTETSSASPDAESTTAASTSSSLPAETSLPPATAETSASATEATVSPEPDVSRILVPFFASNDFTVPSGSTVTPENWREFLRHAIEGELSSYSGTKTFMQAYGFSNEPGAGSGEYQLKCSLSNVWFFPGNGMGQFADNREVLDMSLTVLEQEGKLSLLALQYDYSEAAVPNFAEKALQASYEAWVTDWEAKAGKDIAAIPALTTQIGYEIVGSLSKDFQPPAKGEATADLDGDGTPETVRVTYSGLEESKWEIGVREAVMSSYYEMPEGAYVVDINKADKQREVAITDHGPSSDDHTQLFTYRSGEVVKIGSVSGILFAGDGKGRVSTYARSWQGPLLTWFFRIEYQLDDAGRLAMMPTRWYASDLPLKTKQAMQLYDKPDADEPGVTLQAGTEVIMDLSDISTWFHLKAADGTEGWIKYQNGENLVFPDGSLHNQLDILDGIVSAD